jgi:hypothetical protein
LIRCHPNSPADGRVSAPTGDRSPTRLSASDDRQ